MSLPKQNAKLFNDEYFTLTETCQNLLCGFEEEEDVNLTKTYCKDRRNKHSESIA